MLTQKDIDQIEEIIDEKFEEKLKFFPKKDELYEKLDEILGEIKDGREEQTLQSYRLSDHEDRITKLETVTLSTAR